MKKFVCFSLLVLAMPLSMMAQDDDMYFVPTKKSHVKSAEQTYYVGSNRDVDEYNRRGKFRSTVTPITEGESDDVISFDGVKGVYPDSIAVDSLNSLTVKKSDKRSYDDDYYYDDDDDYTYSRQLDRWYGCYDPWFYGPSYYGRWHSPFWYGYYGYYDPWYTGWYDPWYYGYGWGYYGPYYSGWYDPWFYGYGGFYGGGFGHVAPNRSERYYGAAGGWSNRGRGLSGRSVANTGGRGSMSGGRIAGTRSANAAVSRGGLVSSSRSTGVSRSASSSRSYSGSSSSFTPSSSRSSSGGGFSGGSSSGFSGGSSRGGGFSGGGGHGGRR